MVQNYPKYCGAFGSPMPTRTWSDPNAKYKYGFNGMEKDDETTVNGGDYDFGARIYDSRLGSWLSLDPYRSKFPFWSAFVFVGNSPMGQIDKGGLETEEVATKPPIKMNILVIIPLNATDVTPDMAGVHGDWFVIIANDFVDAYKQFHIYTGTERVDNIVIDTHGQLEGGSLMVANSRSTGDQPTVIRDEDVKKYRKKRAAQIKKGEKIDGGNAQLDAFSMLTLGIKDGGNMIINSCRSAAGINGRSLLNNLGILANYRVNLFMSAGVNDGVTMMSGNSFILRLNVLLFNKNKGKECYDKKPVCYTNKDYPTEGFYMLEAHSKTGKATNLATDGRHEGSVQLNDTSPCVIITNKTK